MGPRPDVAQAGGNNNRCMIKVTAALSHQVLPLTIQHSSQSSGLQNKQPNLLMDYGCYLPGGSTALSTAAALLLRLLLLLHLPQLLPTTKLMVADLSVEPGVGILPLPDVILMVTLVPGAADTSNVVRKRKQWNVAS